MNELTLDIPKVCGVMLLGGTPLFPHSSMDLHIFESRYRAMLDQALNGTWMFAIGNLFQPEDEPYDECVAEIGTLVIVNASRTLPDGRSALVVTGVQPVRFTQWVANSPYPAAHIEPVTRTPIEESQASGLKALLLDCAESKLGEVPAEVKESVLSGLSQMSSTTAIIDNVAHNFVTDSELRNKLMTGLDDGVRASQLITAITS